MKRALIATLMLLASVANAENKAQLKFVDVVHVQPKYVEVKCDPNICQGMPDLRQVGSLIYYRCEGQLYENWIRGSMTVGMQVQVVNCKNMIVTARGEPVVRHPE